MTTTIQVRTNPTTKKSAQRILGKLGLDLSTAINMYLVQIVVKNGIPFDVLTENGFTRKEETELLRLEAEARRSKKSYGSAKELFDDILKK